MVTPGPWFRRTVVLGVGAAIALPACGGQTRGGPGIVDPVACGQPLDGTRLKAFYLTADDGSREYFDLWYDTQLGAGCRFQIASDGQTRCLPFDRGIGSSFLDATCGQAIVDDYAPACLGRAHGVPKYAIRIDAVNECTETFRLFALGVASVPASVYAKISDGVCSAGPNTGSRVFYPVGGEVAPASLVAASVQSQGTRILANYATGADGSRGRVHRILDRANLFDSATGVDCDLLVASDGVLRCLPASSPRVLGQEGFADALCTRRIAIDDRFACVKAQIPTPGWTSVFEVPAPSGNICPDPPRVHVHHLGAADVPATVYTPFKDATGSGCTGAPNPDGMTVYALADETPPSAFASVTLQEQACGPNRTSGARLRAKYETSEDGQRIEGGFWFDTDLGVACVFRSAADGRMRCVPIDQQADDQFSDPACSHAIASADPCPVDDPAPVVPMFAVRRDSVSPSVDACFFDDDEPRLHVHRLGPQVTAQTVYQRAADGSCGAIASADLTPPRAFYEVGDEVPPTRLVAGTYRQF